jgi:hypothetical protein
VVLRMRILLAFFCALILSACSSVPYKERNLDTTTNFKVPSEGKAGVYVYQWKTGFVGSARDVKFEIKGYPIISLNTGEYGYFEVPPGKYEYKLIDGITGQAFIPVEFEAGKNYFFKAHMSLTTDHAVLIEQQIEIDDVKKKISSGWYEPYDVD